MFMPNSEEGPSDDLNETIATYIRVAEHYGFQERMRQSYKRPSSAPKRTSIMLTSSQLASPRPDSSNLSSAGLDSIANCSSLQGGNETTSESTLSSYMNVDADEDDLELGGEDVDETLDSVDGAGPPSYDPNNNTLTSLSSSYHHSHGGGHCADLLPKMLPLSSVQTPERVAEKMLQLLNEIKHQDLEEYMESCTQIMQLHLGHNVRLQKPLFKLVYACTEPAHVNELFNRGVIAPEDVHHFGCFYERNYLFSSIDLSLNGEHNYAFDILMSLVVLVYKSDTAPVRRNLFTCLNRDFTSFVTSDVYEATKKSVAIKCFLRALILTGVLSLPGLHTFLSQHEPVDTSLDSDMESDSVAVFSSSEDDEDGENNSDNDEARAHNRAARAARRAGGSTRKTVAQFLNHLPNTTSDLSSMLPLTLKNRCRIVIKECMTPDHSVKQARKLKMLPKELQDFVSFNDEVDRVLKLNRKLKTMPTMTP